MKTLYIQCNMGAAGDMLSAALLELVDDRDAFLDKLNSVGIPNVKMTAEDSVKCGIKGTNFHVYVDGAEEGEEHKHSHEHHHDHNDCVHTHDHSHDHHHDDRHDHDHGHGHHHHNGIREIRHIVEGHLNIPEKVKQDVMAVFNNVAQAECQVHGKDMEHIHFHEVGTMDAVADITAACMLINEINPDRIIVSPIHVGSGNVKCSHGVLPVPAPATALILKGVPIYSTDVKGELCTPTGAAILKHFADEFGPVPVMKTEAIGYGMGKKDFEQANCVRAILGYTDDSTDSINELSCNLDDMTAEEIGYAIDRLYEAGAAEVFTVPAYTKKNRPGVLLTVLCKDGAKEEIVKVIFKHTSTIGIREQKMNRYVLERKTVSCETPYGTIRRKDCKGYGVTKSKFEFDDLANASKASGKSIARIKKEIEKD
jgi:uncharacterized protein (TIGR00299 family) protein